LGGCAPTYLARFGGVSLAASLASIFSNVASPRFFWYVWPTFWEETVRLTFGLIRMMHMMRKTHVPKAQNLRTILIFF
jgi:hypothetical protein